jgi:thiol-disulfide isomerase/thioredoxin
MPFLMDAQCITGNFPDIANRQVKLFGFNGFSANPIDSVNVSADGTFMLSFNADHYGVGYLVTDDSKAFMVILAPENVSLEGDSFASTDKVKIITGDQNRRLEQFAGDNRSREQALSAWNYLENFYNSDSLFAGHNTALTAIEQEKQRIQAEESSFFANLDPETYLSWYLPVRKLVSSLPNMVKNQTNEIPFTIKAFRNLDYADERLYKSGLLRDIIEGQFWLIENSGLSLDSVFIGMSISIDHIIESLRNDEGKFNEITDFLFKYLEKHNLNKASEYLALKVLNEESCTVDNNLSSQLESYRAMKVGNIAPDFEFKGDVFAPAYGAMQTPVKLSDINSDYTVLAFGASWCPACPNELMKIAGSYQKYKEHNIEVVFISLDEDKEIFKTFIAPFPFISFCDYQKWESPVIKSYHVFATLTLYLINTRQEIILRSNSVHQLHEWIDWNLVQNKISTNQKSNL